MFEEDWSDLKRCIEELMLPAKFDRSFEVSLGSCAARNASLVVSGVFERFLESALKQGILRLILPVQDLHSL
jgi:hypothetical protein